MFVLVVALVLPLVVVLLRVAGGDWPLSRDSAGIDLRARDVFSSHVPLVGAYHGVWSHPGPLMFWIVAPFAAVGGSTGATLIGFAALATAAIAVAAWLAWRYGGLKWLLVVALLAALSYRALDTAAPIVSV